MTFVSLFVAVPVLLLAAATFFYSDSAAGKCGYSRGRLGMGPLGIMPAAIALFFTFTLIGVRPVEAWVGWLANACSFASLTLFSTLFPFRYAAPTRKIRAWYFSLGRKGKLPHQVIPDLHAWRVGDELKVRDYSNGEEYEATFQSAHSGGFLCVKLKGKSYTAPLSQYTVDNISLASRQEVSRVKDDPYWPQIRLQQEAYQEAQAETQADLRAPTNA